MDNTYTPTYDITANTNVVENKFNPYYDPRNAVVVIPYSHIDPDRICYAISKSPYAYVQECVLHPKVIFVGRFFQYTVRDRILWDNLVLHDSLPEQHLGLGAKHARKLGLLPDEYYTTNNKPDLKKVVLNNVA